MSIVNSYWIIFIHVREHLLLGHGWKMDIILPGGWLTLAKIIRFPFCLSLALYLIRRLLQFDKFLFSWVKSQIFNMWTRGGSNSNWFGSNSWIGLNKSTWSFGNSIWDRFVCPIGDVVHLFDDIVYTIDNPPLTLFTSSNSTLNWTLYLQFELELTLVQFDLDQIISNVD